MHYDEDDPSKKARSTIKPLRPDGQQPPLRPRLDQPAGWGAAQLVYRPDGGAFHAQRLMVDLKPPAAADGDFIHPCSNVDSYDEWPLSHTPTREYLERAGLNIPSFKTSTREYLV